jgi:hypothetical protein
MTVEEVLVKGEQHLLVEIFNKADINGCELYINTTDDLEKIPGSLKQKIWYVHNPVLINTSHGQKLFALTDEKEIGEKSEEAINKILSMNLPNLKGIVFHTDLDCCDVRKESKSRYIKTAVGRIKNILQRKNSSKLLCLENNPLDFPTVGKTEGAYCKTEDLEQIIDIMGKNVEELKLVLDIEHFYKTILTKPIYEEIMKIFRREDELIEAYKKAHLYWVENLPKVYEDFIVKVNEELKRFFDIYKDKISILHVCGYDPYAKQYVIEGNNIFFPGAHLPVDYKGRTQKPLKEGVMVEDRIDQKAVITQAKRPDVKTDIVLEFDPSPERQAEQIISVHNYYIQTYI